MKKLKNKVFFTIFSILTLFSITILIFYNYQSYRHEKVSIEENLIKLNNNRPQNKDEVKFYMDTTIYTVLLNNKNEIISIISHNELNNINENINEITKNIIDKNEPLKIGNLYFNKYSYSYTPFNKIIIIDNTITNFKLQNLLKGSFVLLVATEMLIFIISYFLTKWIIKPVIESFDRQKRFITDASHELKTPLSVIMASSEALETDINEKKWLNNIKNESERMNKLISNLLDLSKIENEDIKKAKTKNDISKITEMSILTLESLIYEKNIGLEYNIDDNIMFFCDTEEIKQLLAILLDNAIKHSTKDGKIMVNLNKNKEEIILEVKNKGIPIPPGEEEKIFERFYRVDKSRNRNENRYGLGLAIAKAIVLNHNGVISAFSKDDITTFKVVFKNKEH